MTATASPAWEILASEQRKTVQKFSREQLQRLRAEMHARMMAKCPPPARESLEASNQLFWAPDSLRGVDRDHAVELVKNGVPTPTVLNIVRGKTPGLRLVVDSAKQTQYSDDDWRQHNQRVNRVNGTIKKAERAARKKQEEWDAHNRRVAALNKLLDEPEQVLRRHPSAKHEASHFAVALACGCEIDLIESREGGGGTTHITWREDTSPFQKIATTIAGPVATGPTASEAMDRLSSRRPGTDASQLLDLLENYLWIDPGFKAKADHHDLIHSPELKAIAAEVRAWLDVHENEIQDLALRVARAGRIDLDSTPCVVDLLDEFEKKLAPFPKHPQSWAVAKSRTRFLETNLRLAAQDPLGKESKAYKQAVAEFDAEKSALGAACHRHHAAILKSLGTG